MKEMTKPLSHYGSLQREVGLPNHPEEMGPKISKLLSKFQSRVAYHPWFLGFDLPFEGSLLILELFILAKMFCTTVLQIPEV
jgi:hypothetical protein